MSGLNYLFVGADNPEAFMIGNDEVEVIYMGEEIVYQKGDGSGISMKSNANVGTKSGSTYVLKITSSEPWTLSVDTAVTWLNFSQLTGDTGETIVTITATEDNQTGNNRATTITATTANYSATCEVTQIAVILVDYIHETTLTADTKHFIDTLVMHTTGTSFRVKGIVKYNNGNVIVGYQTNDSSDYRLFWAGRNPYYDINNARLGPYSNMAENTKVDFYCYNYGFSLNGNTLGTGQTQTSITAPETIKVDIGSWWLQSLEIWDGETKVFDGHAAVEDNVIGLYDSITESMFTTSAYTLTTEQINLDLYSTNVPQTDAYITIGGDTYYLYDKSQGDYEMLSNEEVICYLTKRYNGGQICVLKDLDNNNTYNLKVTGNTIDIYQDGNLLYSVTGGNKTIDGMRITNYIGSSGNEIKFKTTDANWEISQIAPYFEEHERVCQYECRVYDNDNSTSYLITKENCPVYGFTHNSPIRFFISDFGNRNEKAIAKLHHPSEASSLYRYLYVYTDGRIGFGTPNDITVINVGNGAVIGEYSVTNTSNYVEITGGYVPRITIEDLYY